MDKQKQAYTLISEYQKLYRKKYNKLPLVNKYKEKWGMMDMIDSWGFDETKDLLKYYFKTGERGHSLSTFYNKSDALVMIKTEAEADARHRLAVMEETRRRVEQEEED